MQQFSEHEECRVICTPSATAKKTFFYLQEAGRLRTGEQHATARQNLKSYLFVVVMEGMGTLEYEDEIHQVTKGECFFIDCRRPHSYRSSVDTPWELLWTHFDGCTSDQYYELFSAQSGPVFRPFSTVKFVTIIQEILRLHHERHADTEILTSHQLNALLTMLLTVHNIDREGETALHEKLKAVLAYVDSNFCEELSLDALSRQFFISKYYLTREFKKAYGETIFQHIISMRINYAKRLLRFTDKSIDEISELCGFHDQSYFTKQFKKAESVTCLAYRKNWRD